MNTDPTPRYITLTNPVDRAAIIVTMATDHVVLEEYLQGSLRQEVRAWLGRSESCFVQLINGLAALSYVPDDHDQYEDVLYDLCMRDIDWQEAHADDDADA